MTGSYLKDFRVKFEKLGYRKWKGAPVFATHDIWYIFLERDETFHVAYFEYQSGRKAYGIRLGAFNVNEIINLRSILPIILRYQKEYLPDIDLDRLLPWMLFIPARGRYLDLASIPDPMDRPRWTVQLDIMVERFLKPIFWSIHSEYDLYKVLLSDKFPCEWTVGHPILRLARVFSLAKIMNLSIDEVRKSINSIIYAVDPVINCGMSADDMLHDVMNSTRT